LAVYKSTSVAAGGRSKKKTDKKIYENIDFDVKEITLLT
jgi:hypothetical protein